MELLIPHHYVQHVLRMPADAVAGPGEPRVQAHQPEDLRPDAGAERAGRERQARATGTAPPTSAKITVPTLVIGAAPRHDGPGAHGDGWRRRCRNGRYLLLPQRQPHGDVRRPAGLLRRPDPLHARRGWRDGRAAAARRLRGDAGEGRRGAARAAERPGRRLQGRSGRTRTTSPCPAASAARSRRDGTRSAAGWTGSAPSSRTGPDHAASASRPSAERRPGIPGAARAHPVPGARAGDGSDARLPGHDARSAASPRAGGSSTARPTRT